MMSDHVTRPGFCRVFSIEDIEPPGFCFGGGRPVAARMVDWFDAYMPDGDDFGAAPTSWTEAAERLPDFLRQKQYARPGLILLVITNAGETLALQIKEVSA